MAMSGKRRRLLLGVALAVTVGLVAWVGREGGEEPAGEAPPDKAARRESAKAGGPPARDELSLSRAETPPAGQGDGAPQAPAGRDLFQPQSWNPPPTPPAPGPTAEAGPKPPPSAPEVPEPPFTYLGRMIEDNRTTVYLATPERNLLVRQGDVIEREWRLVAIHPNWLEFRYLPLGRKKLVRTGREQ